MKAFKKSAALPLLVLGALILGVLLRWMQLQGGGTTVTLKDGSQFVVRDVTYGTNHSYYYGKLLPRLLRPMLPQSLQDRLGLSVYSTETATRGVIIWGHWSGVKTDSACLLTVVDAMGVESEPIWGFPLPSVNQQAEPEMAWKCINFPRREKGLRFKLYRGYGTGAREFIGELRLRNPSAKSYPQWQPATYPISQTNGLVGFDLVRVSPANIPLLSGNPRRPAIGMGHTALLKITKQGLPTREWEPWKLTITDATGNILNPLHERVEPISDFFAYHFSGALWSSEQGWKFSFALVQRTNLVNSNLCTFHEVAFPTNMAPVQVAAYTNVQGATVSMLTLRRTTPFPQLGGFPRQNAEVALLVSDMGRPIHVSLLKATSSRGEVVRFGDRSLDPAGWRFPLEVPPATESLSFEFALQVPWNVEFTAGVEAGAQPLGQKR